MKGLFFAVVGIFAITIYWLAIYDLKKMASVDFKLYEMAFLTTGEFTAEMEIDAEMWTHF